MVGANCVGYQQHYDWDTVATTVRLYAQSSRLRLILT